MIDIRFSKEDDSFAILELYKAAFPDECIDNLVNDFFNDVTAKPLVSLVATDNDNDRVIGHVLCSCAWLNTSKEEIEASLLAPLAVHPDYQNKGIGGELINGCFKELANSNAKMVFVLGYPDYYNKFGFETAGVLWLDAPYPIPEKNADAWMVKFIKKIDFKGKLKVAKAIDKLEYWQE